MSNKKKIKAQKVNAAPKGGKKTSVWKAKIWPAIKSWARTLISNDACVEKRNAKWYGPLAVAIVSLIVALVPMMVTSFSQSGGTVIDSPTYNMDTGLAEFSRYLEANDIVLEVEGGKLVNPGNTWRAHFAEKTPQAYLHSYTYQTVVIPSTGNDSSSSSSSEQQNPVYETVTSFDFAVYFIGDSDLTPAEYASENVLSRSPMTIGDGTYNPKTTSFMVLSNNGFVIYKMPNYDGGDSNSVLASTAGEWSTSSLEGLSLGSLASKNLEGAPYTVSYESDPRAYVNEVRLAWRQVFHDGAAYGVMINGLTWVGIVAAIFVALTFILGLTVFLMTRGKRNPFNVYTFWQSQKIAYWASFTPAVLAMILSFIVPSWAILFYIFLFGMRIMWMSMRSLRPQYTE